MQITLIKIGNLYDLAQISNYPELLPKVLHQAFDSLSFGSLSFANVTLNQSLVILQAFHLLNRRK